KELLNNPELGEHHKSLGIVESQIYRCKDSLTKITASTGTTQAIDGSVVSIESFIKKIKSHLLQPQDIELTFAAHTNTRGSLLIDKTLVQSLVNLITNALESNATVVDVNYETYDESLVITVADNGSGLKSNIGQLNKSEKEFGMGLGLFLAQATIERFSGTIRVNNYTTQGTQLEITLPLVKT
ncbi:MAG TPA: HAMP domain-containing histidine kinase, partial [Oceanospirillales bacterium]|nr:HAMP domain-containing histidine kinase [Oceanospirillales bacterium]